MLAQDETIAYCHACGTAMDVTLVAPFSNVECPSCGKHTRVKREFGPYTLLRRHAIGGMSMVFAGHDNTLDREVAIKILSETYSADEKRITAFEEEARITASISHPHVVRVIKTGKAFGRFYIAMEMVTGGHLEHQIKERGAVPEVEALTWAIQVAEGLRAAHSVGLIHRDIKPGNILLDSAGSAKIVDFGLALMTKGGVAKPDELWATPFYVPPETVDGRAEDYRADVYAFGATFYHIIAGKPPCTEESMVTTQLREAKKKVIPLSLAFPDLALETADVIDRAMAYDPSARFTSYDELIVALQSALLSASARAKGSRVKTPTAASRQKEAAQRKRIEKVRNIQRIAIVATFLVVATAATWAIIQYRNRPADAVAPINQPVIADVSPYDDVPSTGIDTASAYQSARSLLQQSDFAGSSMFFRRLFDNASVPEPTRTLSGLESLLSDQLNGNNKSARETGNAMIAHMSKNNITDLRPILNPWLIEFRELAAAAPEMSNINDPIRLLVVMSAALKNWESGMIDQALPLFKIIRDAKINDPTGLTTPYKKIAADYFLDAELIKKSYPAQLPDTEDACNALVSQLDETINELKTRGRAKFMVREWQLQLKRKAARLSDRPNSSDAAKNNTPYSSIADNIRRLDLQLEFIAALESLKQSQPANSQEQSARTSLIAMHEAAASFLNDIAKDINKSPLSLSITTKDGRNYQQAAGVSDGMITLMQGSTEASLPWSDLSTPNIIAIYREAIRKAPSAENLAPRHEAAICFQWLSGETDAATAAAEKFSKVNPAFQNRWQEWMKSIKK
jgi:eukaryotic-like serine/threonine-protein kinase